MQNEAKTRISKQVAHGVSKQWWALLQCWIRAQNKPIYSLHHAPKQITHRPKILCKIMAYKGVMKQVQNGGPKQGKALNERWNRAQKNSTFSFGQSSKQQAKGAKKTCKNALERGRNQLTLEDQSFAASWIKKSCLLASEKTSKLLEWKW